MKFDRTAPGGGVNVVCRLENAKAYLEWNCYFVQEEVPFLPAQAELTRQTAMSEQTKNSGNRCKAWPACSSMANAGGSVRIYLADPKGIVVMECFKALQEEEPLEGILLQPHLWQGVENPYLYVMEAVLTDRNGACIDRLRRHLPLRDLKSRNTVNGKEILFNGEIFIPKGVIYTLPNAEKQHYYEPEGNQTSPSETGCLYRFGAQQQRLILEDLRQMIQLGANCICMEKKVPEKFLLQFCRLCDRYGILVFCQEGEKGKDDWIYSQDKGIRMQHPKEAPDFRSLENGLFLPDNSYPNTLYYQYKAKWSDVPFVYLVPKSMKKLQSGNYSVCCYSNCNKVALYTDGTLFEFQTGGGEIFFREIPAKSPCIILTAEGDGCSMSVSVHKLLLNNFSH